MSQDILYTYYQNFGNIILLKYRKNGQSYTKKIDFYKPSFYMPANGEEYDATTMFKKKVTRRLFDSISEAKNFAKQYKDVDGIEWYGNSNYANQFIIELYEGQTPVFDPSAIRIGILDIEVHTKTFPDPVLAEKPINGITIYDNFTDTYYCMGNSEYVRERRVSLGETEEAVMAPMYVHNPDDADVGSLKVVYTEFADEEGLVRAILKHFKEFNYDMTSGWNSESFDMVYIVKRFYQIVGEDYTKSMLSPFKRINFREGVDKFGKEEVKVDIVGLPHIDYMLAYRKHIFEPRDSYRLDNIAYEELGENKLDYEAEGSLYELHLQNPQKFLAYNIKDVKLIKQLNDKLKLFELTITLAYYCMCNYEETLGTVRPWEMLIAKQLYNNNQVPPFSTTHKTKVDYPGGFVKEVLPGFWKWLVAFDYNSLYPMTEIQCNIGSETHVPRHKLPKQLRELKGRYNVDDIVNKRVDLSALQGTNLSMTANFEFYDKNEKSVIAQIKDDLYTMRKVYKKKMQTAQNSQEAIKDEMKKRGLVV